MFLLVWVADEICDMRFLETILIKGGNKIYKAAGVLVWYKHIYFAYLYKSIKWIKNNKIKHL